MAIIVNLDLMLVKRKMSLTELSPRPQQKRYEACWLKALSIWYQNSSAS
jgi:hypothetical protein